ncbi:hypothetical protein BJV74DRAFT_579467 [Russula compacta]|nr:hypothetical protein BJV74DRAFT_579467 [Russula compacta]
MAKSRKRRAEDVETCPYCGREWNTMGLSSHVRSCKRKREDRLQDLAYDERIRGDLKQDGIEDAEVAGERRVQKHLVSKL